MDNIVAYASLIISGSKVDSNGITELTGIKNDEIKRKRHDLWIIKSEGKLESKEIEKHIDWLLDKIEIYIPEIFRLFAPDRFEVSCYWFSKNGHGGPFFSSKLIQRLARNSLALWIDTYFE